MPTDLTSLAGNPPRTPLTRMVDHDLPCARCGYNLRTLDAGANCPECAAPVAHSLSLSGLALPDRRRLRLMIVSALVGYLITPVNVAQVLLGYRVIAPRIEWLAVLLTSEAAYNAAWGA